MGRAEEQVWKGGRGECSCQVWWHIAIMSALRGLRQETELKALPGLHGESLFPSKQPTPTNKMQGAEGQELQEKVLVPGSALSHVGGVQGRMALSPLFPPHCR